MHHLSLAVVRSEDYGPFCELVLWVEAMTSHGEGDGMSVVKRLREHGSLFSKSSIPEVKEHGKVELEAASTLEAQAHTIADLEARVEDVEIVRKLEYDRTQQLHSSLQAREATIKELLARVERVTSNVKDCCTRNEALVVIPETALEGLLQRQLRECYEEAMSAREGNQAVQDAAQEGER